MNPTQTLSLLIHIVLLVFVFFAPTGDAIFGLVEVDWLNDTIYLSPVQVMFLGIFLMFLVIVGFFQWSPTPVSPIPQIGRMLTGNAALNATTINAGIQTFDNMFQLGKVHDPFSVKISWSFCHILSTTSYFCS